MGFSNSLNGNRRKTMPEGINLDDLEFTHVKNLKKKDLPMPVCGYFINKSKYGLNVTLIGKTGKDEYIGLNIPSWYVERFRDATDEDVQQILDGRLMIEEVEEITTSNGTTYQIKFADVDE